MVTRSLDFLTNVAYSGHSTPMCRCTRAVVAAVNLRLLGELYS